MSFFVPHERTTDLDPHDDAFVLVVIVPEYRTKNISSYDKTANAKFLVEIDHSYATPSRNTSISLCIILRAQHLIEMTNSLTRYDFSWCNLDAWCLGKMVPNWIRPFPWTPNPGVKCQSHGYGHGAKNIWEKYAQVYDSFTHGQHCSAASPRVAVILYMCVEHPKSHGSSHTTGSWVCR